MTAPTAGTSAIPRLRFIGQEGELTHLVPPQGRAMYVVDANLVLTLLNTNGQSRVLPKEYQNYLSVTRRQVGLQWLERARYVPVNAALAALELSQSGSMAMNRIKFNQYFYDYLRIVHGVGTVPSAWVDTIFEPLSRFTTAQLSSFAAVVERTFDLTPPGDTPSEAETEAACDELFGWMLTRKSELAFLGGSVTYAAVYAIAGSPDARRIFKMHETRKRGSNKLAWNVAWDFVYLEYLERLYSNREYTHSLFCTADGALATLMASKTGARPRPVPGADFSPGAIEGASALAPFKFKKLDGTHLSRRLAAKYLETMKAIAKTTAGVVAVGF